MADLRVSERTLIETSRRLSIRAIYLTLGITMLILSFVGMLLPIMPTTIFLILAAWFFGRSSPRLEAWLLNHPRFGQTLRNWQDEGAIPAGIKAVAVIGMLGGFIIFFVTSLPGHGWAFRWASSSSDLFSSFSRGQRRRQVWFHRKRSSHEAQPSNRYRNRCPRVWSSVEGAALLY